MSCTFIALLSAGGLFLGMLFLQEVGRRIGGRRSTKILVELRDSIK